MGLAVTVIGTTVVRAMRNKNEAVSVSRMVFFFLEEGGLQSKFEGMGMKMKGPDSNSGRRAVFYRLGSCLDNPFIYT